MIKLRDFKLDDACSVQKHANNLKVSRYLTSRFPYPYTQKDAEWWVSVGYKELGVAKAIDLNGESIGCVGFHPGKFERSHCAEIGYWLSEEHWSKGYATEALNEMTNIALSNTKIMRLYAPVFDPNKASMRVLEKCGYKKEAVVKKSIFKNDEYYDEHIYSLLRL